MVEVYPDISEFNETFMKIKDKGSILNKQKRIRNKVRDKVDEKIDYYEIKKNVNKSQRLNKKYSL